MSKQNIYDNDTFFEGYKEIRYCPINHNDLIETPAFFSLLPSLKNKTILDLGCGFGINAKKFVMNGADKVVAVDISENMISFAKKENSDEKIEYLQLPMENISSIKYSFDLVVSSLAIHYVENYNELLADIYKILEDGGEFVFSIEHPVFTSHNNEDRWLRDNDNKKLAAKLYSYGIEGIRRNNWIVEGIEVYHRTFSTIINTLIKNKFSIEKLIEPVTDEETRNKYPEFKDLLQCPNFLVIKAKKC